MGIIDIEHVTKEFRLGEQTNLKQNLRSAWARLRGHTYEPRKPFRALDDVSLSIDQGEVVGLIGTNGAGKSTLLKIISGITDATSGRVKVRGRIAPLIEVGAGLHPELTGRENIFLNASILGVPRKVIRSKVEEIAEFAELEDFLDTPIKRYSSGMKVRLGFAIATSVDAEILIVDEVLAVGDLAFQRKCFDRMEGLIRREGRTVLIVSHNIRQINRLCTRGVLLHAGKTLLDDSPDRVCNLFYARSQAAATPLTRSAHGPCQLRNAGVADLVSLTLLDDCGQPISALPQGAALRIHVNLRIHQPLEAAELVLGTHTPDFVYVTAHSTHHSLGPLHLDPGTFSATLEIPFFPFKQGTYSLRLVLFGNKGDTLLEGDNLATFTIRPAPDEAQRPPLRLVDLPARWHLHTSGAAVAALR